MNINSYFNKAYCINLDERKDRWLSASAEFQKHSLKVERYSAIKGNPNNIPAKVSDGCVGCILSHLNIIKDAKKNKYSQVAVFEDDVIFADDLNKQFIEFYKQVPKDWDMVYFGGNHNNTTLNKISTNVAKVTNTYTTHAYLIKDTIYDAVINLFAKPTHEADVLYAMIQKKFNCYVLVPHLAWQADGYSDILNQEIEYGFLKRNGY